MTKPLYLLFSHTLTEEQIADAWQSLGVTDFVTLPPDLQQRFSNVPPELETLEAYLAPVFKWVAERAGPSHYFLVQGDFGATHLLVSYIKSEGLGVPIYATTSRQSVDEKMEDGSIVTRRVFKHQRFRRY